jgi:hypothetical protein
VRRIATAALLASLAAGCGSGGSRDAKRLHAWTIPDEAFIPDVPPAPRARPAPAKQAPPVRHGPSDAQIRAELRQLYGGDDATARRITLSGNGNALAPPDAPSEVQTIVAAANQVARLPYVYGGGHGRAGPEGTWVDSAYDCSGSVSFALASAGLLDSPLDSTGLAAWGKPGPGKWVTIFANAGHAFMEVGGVRFDTVGLRRSGSRWQPAYRSIRGFTVRHPPGL